MKRKEEEEEEVRPTFVWIVEAFSARRSRAQGCERGGSSSTNAGGRLAN